jgi:heptosyltransferase-1
MPDAGGPRMKILIVRLSSLGDVVHNMPMVADILARHPDAQIDWIVEEAYAGLIALNKGVRDVIPIALRRWRKQLGRRSTWREIADFCRRLQREQYDYVFDTQGLLKSGIVMGIARTAAHGIKLGLANGTEGCGYEAPTRWFQHKSVAVSPRAHAVMRARLVAAAGLGYSPSQPADFLLAAPAMPAPAWLPDGPYAVFFHATARASKQWDSRNWVETGKAIRQLGMPVLLPWGSAGERQAAAQLAAQIPDAIVLPRLPLLEAVLLAERARLVVGVDTGLTHIAAAYRRPTVEIYCDSPVWNTAGDWSPAVVNLGDRGKPPGAEQVWQAIERLCCMTSA